VVDFGPSVTIPQVPTVSICIATYKRPDGLKRLLESLRDATRPPEVSLEIVVVDNDPRTAEPVTHAFREASAIQVRYGVQPEPNISLTRNASVESASGEFIWFIDDDEVAEQDCLLHLWKTIEEFHADVVFGQIAPSFADETPDWIQEASTFNRPAVTTGQRSEAGRTGNTLLRRSILDGIDGPFDPDLGRSGGEDSQLFGKLRTMGFNLVDCAEAVVVESIPPSRATWTWMASRSRRLGYLYARNSAGRGRFVMAVLYAKAGARVAPLWIVSFVTRKNIRRSSELQMQMWSCIGRLDFMREQVTGTDRRPDQSAE
jgi:succinoglycan biosynthesis protein ExoM